MRDERPGSRFLLPRLGRRGVGILLAGGAATLARPALAQLPGLRGSRLVFASWGGAYQNAQKEAFCEPFARRTGATVIQDGPVDYAKYRVMMRSGAPTWDVMDIEAAFLVGAAPDGLFERIDTSIVDTTRLDPKYVHEYGVGTIVWSYTLGYSKTTYPGTNVPQGWADLFDLRRFPGRRMLRDRAVPMLEIALLADGVPADRLYPLDIDRAFRKMDTIKQSSVFWSTNSQCQQLLADGEVTMGVINNGRLYDLVKKGLPLGVVWNQSLQAVDYLVVPKGSRNRAAAMELIAESTTPAAQASTANAMATAPTNPAAFAAIEEAAKPWMSTNPDYASTSLLIDETYWRDSLRPLSERWNRWKLA
jgi:putative spermidine/putrescine transport system substrate-binding protein